MDDFNQNNNTEPTEKDYNTVNGASQNENMGEKENTAETHEEYFRQPGSNPGGQYQNGGTPPFYSQQYGYSSNYSEPVNPPKKKNKSIKVIIGILAAAVVIAGITIGWSSFLKGSSFSDSSSSSSSSQSSSKTGNKDSGGSVVYEAKAESGALSTPEIAKIAQRSSVGVVVYSTKNSGAIFGNGYKNGSGEGDAAGEGTGVIIKLDNQGDYTYVMTCAHVISDKDISVKILLEDGQTFDAEIVGYDVRTDIGLLRINNKSLQKNAAIIGKSSELQVGQGVFAIGNPGGSEFFGSFTSGVVSSIGRSLSSSTGYTMECIQHDAAINPGNSGGGLLNAKGELIGINSSKIASTEYEGMSFAVPIDRAVEVVNDLSAYGYIPNRPKLGITYSLATKYNQAYAMVVQFKGLPSGSLVIASINSDSSLANTKAQKGDMIVSANGKKLDTADVLLDLIENGKVGDVVELGICRVSNDYRISEFTVKVKLVEDRGTGSVTDEEETTAINPNDYWNYFFDNN